MKKFATTLILLSVLSISIFAEGEIPIGNKTCPQGQQTCLVNEGEIPIGNKSDNSIIKSILDFLKSVL